MINSYHQKQTLYVETLSTKKKKIANVHKGYGMTLYNITTALPTTRYLNVPNSQVTFRWFGKLICHFFGVKITFRLKPQY